MTKYICTICNCDFKQKSNFINHTVNKKKPCVATNKAVSQQIINITDFIENEKIISNDNDELIVDNDDDDDEEITVDNNTKTCKYCEKTFTRNNNLQKHIKERCKSKLFFDELENLKKKLGLFYNDNLYLKKENEKLKEENEKFKNEKINNTNLPKIINNVTNKNDNKQINNGIINNVNIQVVQFGNEDIDKLDLADAIKLYLKSTGGNIVPNMLKFINLNEKYPENHNICITDISREIVKMHNGKKFIYKKFKNAKHDILDKVVNHIKKLVDKYENNDAYKKSQDINSKLKINNNSLKLICGQDIEETDSEEEDDDNEDDDKNKDKNKNKDIKNKKNNNENENENDNENDNDIDNDKFNIENAEAQILKLIANNKKNKDANNKKQYSANIEHLNSKKEGLQKITFEKMKEELRNSKELLDGQKEELLL